MTETVMVLTPNVRRQEIVERRYRLSPRNSTRAAQPFRVLVEHRVDNVYKGFVAREQPMPAGEQISLEPTLAKLLAQHFHHSAVWRNVYIAFEYRCCRNAISHFKQCVQTVGARLVRTHHSEVCTVIIQLHHVAQIAPEDFCSFGVCLARHCEGRRICPEVGQNEITQ